MKTTLVTGGTGTAGRALVCELLSRRFRVRLLVRDPGKAEIFGERVEIVVGDILNQRAVEQALMDVGYVFHLAADLGGKGSLPEEIWRVNVDGTRLLTETACRMGAKRMVYFSSISVYGAPCIDFPADEASRVRPDSLYAESKLAAEKIILSHNNLSGDPLGVVLRVASVYGPAAKKNYSRLISMIRWGVFVQPGRGAVHRTLIHDRDLARAAVLSASVPRAGGEIYNVTDGSFHALGDIAIAIGRALKRKFIWFCLPMEPVMRLMLFFGRRWLSFLDLSGIRNLFDKMIKDTAVSGEKILVDLGFKPTYDLDSGWQDAVGRYLKSRLL